MSLRALAKRWLPPALALKLRRYVPGSIRFSGNYRSWAEAAADSSGYDAALILESVSNAMQKVASDGGYERDSVIFDQPQHSFPVLAGLLRAALVPANRLSVLDFGGSLGSSYLQCREFLSVLPAFRWGIVEQEHFVERGRQRFQTDQLRFYRSIAECILEAAPNVALLSSVLQYLPSPDTVIDELVNSGMSCVIVDRTPFVEGMADRITIQHVPASIYQASYPCRIFGRQAFLDRFRPRYKLLAEFDSLDGAALADGVLFRFSGMIFSRNE